EELVRERRDATERGQCFRFGSAEQSFTRRLDGYGSAVLRRRWLSRNAVARGEPASFVGRAGNGRLATVPKSVAALRLDGVDGGLVVDFGIAQGGGHGPRGRGRREGRGSSGRRWRGSDGPKGRNGRWRQTHGAARQHGRGHGRHFARRRRREIGRERRQRGRAIVVAFRSFGRER